MEVYEFLPKPSAKQLFEEQLKKDVEAFLLSGGEIQVLPPARSKTSKREYTDLDQVL